MYCSKCGTEIRGDLKYCNKCGQRLHPETDIDGMPGKMLDNILTTLFLVAILGLGILVGLVAVLLDKDVPTQFVIIISLGYLAAIFGICVSLVRQVTKLVDHRLGGSRVPASPDHELPLPTTARLPEHLGPVDSVTDATTRTLEAPTIRQN